ncbi:MAG TPA: Spy/CpxP family protein refolding chaperone [Hyphomicrobiaceae bacterium]|nr:Spy/CpxP family protein refolding chaperone [Hyphomicrobiaceae bacterium]
MAKRTGAVVLAGLTATALCLWSDAAAARGGHFGGGMGFGGGGMRFGGGHFGGGGMRFGGAPFGGMRFGGGGMRFGGGHFGGGGMRFGGGPFMGGPRFGGAPFGGMRFGRGPFMGGPRFGNLPGRGPTGFNANRAVNRPLARATPGSMGQHAFARGNAAGVNRFAGMAGAGAAAAGAAAGRALHGQAGAASGRPFHAFDGRGLGRFQHAGFRHNAFASKVAFHNWAFKHPGCCGWFGKVFWPFVVGDVFTAVLWPSPWYEPFWGYGGDYALSNVLWVGSGSLQASYSNSNIYDIYGGGSGRYGSLARSEEKVANAPSSDTPTEADVTQACADLAPGVTDLPINEIERTVLATGDQVAALTALKGAWMSATKIIKATCTGEVPLTPVRRLDVVEERLGAVLQGLQIVSGPLENFHNSLSEAQKRSFDTMMTTNRDRSEPGTALAGRLTSLCSDRAASFSRLPIDKIEQVIRPGEQQRDALDALKSASAKASEELNASCPAQTPQSLPDRLHAVEQRLAAMIAALRTVRPALTDFYGSLSDEQKARFNMMGQPSQGSTGRNARQAGAN